MPSRLSVSHGLGSLSAAALAVSKFVVQGAIALEDLCGCFVIGNRQSISCHRRLMLGSRMQRSHLQAARTILHFPVIRTEDILREGTSFCGDVQRSSFASTAIFFSVPLNLNASLVHRCLLLGRWDLRCARHRQPAHPSSAKMLLTWRS